MIWLNRDYNARFAFEFLVVLVGTIKMVLLFQLPWQEEVIWVKLFKLFRLNVLRCTHVGLWVTMNFFDNWINEVFLLLLSSVVTSVTCKYISILLTMSVCLERPQNGSLYRGDAVSFKHDSNSSQGSNSIFFVTWTILRKLTATSCSRGQVPDFTFLYTTKLLGKDVYNYYYLSWW